jgi:primosomal replication protein N
MNRLILAAELVERGATRYTPAGLPALDLGLKAEHVFPTVRSKEVDSLP